jgi:hypothetical protein
MSGAASVLAPTSSQLVGPYQRTAVGPEKNHTAILVEHWEPRKLPRFWRCGSRRQITQTTYQFEFIASSMGFVAATGHARPNRLLRRNDLGSHLRDNETSRSGFSRAPFVRFPKIRNPVHGLVGCGQQGPLRRGILAFTHRQRRFDCQDRARRFSNDALRHAAHQ